MCEDRANFILLYIGVEFSIYTYIYFELLFWGVYMFWIELFIITSWIGYDISIISIHEIL